MPKHTDDKDARGAAEVFFENTNQEIGNTQEVAPLVNSFPVVEFETATKTVEGETVTLRRVVLVGPWEVVK
jgi:hypothetical protein